MSRVGFSSSTSRFASPPSLDGGEMPLWSQTGRELFYQTTTVPILDTRDLRLGTPRRLFATTEIDGASISADDRCF
jgi:hypothetical protein